MEKVIDWLMYVEMIAARLYSEAANYFNTPSFIQFLKHSAKDEEYHHQMMATAHDIIGKYPEIESAFVIDEEIKAPIEHSFQRIHENLKSNSLSKEIMIDCIVDTEYSEWNTIFLYVINTLKSIHPEFNPVAAKIQRHLRYIEHYLNSDDYGQKKIRAIQKLEPVWEERILIIDDDPTITELLTAVLKKEGLVDTAANGEAGFLKIQQNYYRMIISDIDMPLMDGITLYRKAHKIYPSIQERYLFLTGAPSSKTIAYLDSQGIKFLKKPASIQEIKNHVVTAMYNITGN